MKATLRLFLVFAVFLGGVITGCQVDDWFDIDSCLDAGGAWDYSRQTCRYQ